MLSPLRLPCPCGGVLGSSRRLWDCAVHVAIPQSVLWVLTTVAKPRDREVRRTSDWSRLGAPCPFHADSLADCSNAFLFALGLRSEDPAELRLVRGRLGPSVRPTGYFESGLPGMGVLSDELPGLWWDWDKCGRLIRALAHRAASADFDVIELSDCCESDEQFHRVLEVLADERRLGKYFDAIAREAQRPTSSLPQPRRRLVVEARAEHRR